MKPGSPEWLERVDALVEFVKAALAECDRCNVPTRCDPEIKAYRRLMELSASMAEEKAETKRGTRKYQVWACKIVLDGNSVLPSGFDWPPRKAATEAIEAAGFKVISCFSGWGGMLEESEAAVIEDREPVFEKTDTARKAALEKIAAEMDAAKLRWRAWEMSRREYSGSVAIEEFARRIREALE